MARPSLVPRLSPLRFYLAGVEKDRGVSPEYCFRPLIFYGCEIISGQENPGYEARLDPGSGMF